jgi:hypothetical protein
LGESDAGGPGEWFEAEGLVRRQSNFRTGVFDFHGAIVGSIRR